MFILTTISIRFQIGRSSESPIDFVVMDTVPGNRIVDKVSLLMMNKHWQQILQIQIQTIMQ